MSTSNIDFEISRIIQGKDLIRTAAQNKGVSIPENALIDEYPAYLEDIPSSAIVEPHIFYYDYSASNSAFNKVEVCNMPIIPSSYFIRQQRTAEFIIGEDTTTIKDAVFYSNTAMTTVSLPSTLSSIGNNAFYQCTALDNVHLASTNIEIQIRSFNGCTGIITFSVVENFNSDLPLPTCSSLSQDSVSNIITNYKNGSGKKLTVHASVYAAIPQTELDRAAAKGLTIASA